MSFYELWLMFYVCFPFLYNTEDIDNKIEICFIDFDLDDKLPNVAETVGTRKKAAGD